MLFAIRFASLGRLAAIALVTHAWLAAAGAPARAEDEAKHFQPQPSRTGKERLGGKPSDEQRVDDCKVPRDLRGPKPRPDDCGDAGNTKR